MVHVERTFLVRKETDKVVEYLKDFANAEVWGPGTVSCKRVDSGPIHSGSQWHNVSEFKGKQTELAYELKYLAENRLTFVGENKTATSTDDLNFTTVPEGTSITYHADIVFHGIAKLADPFLKHEFERLGDEVVTTMTRVLEALK